MNEICGVCGLPIDFAAGERFVPQPISGYRHVGDYCVKRLAADNARLAGELAAERRISLMHATQKDALAAELADVRRKAAHDGWLGPQAAARVIRERDHLLALLRDVEAEMRNGGVTDWSKFLPYLDAALAGPTRTADQPSVVRCKECNDTGIIFWDDQWGEPRSGECPECRSVPTTAEGTEK